MALVPPSVSEAGYLVLLLVEELERLGVLLRELLVYEVLHNRPAVRLGLAELFRREGQRVAGDLDQSKSVELNRHESVPDLVDGCDLPPLVVRVGQHPAAELVDGSTRRQRQANHLPRERPDREPEEEPGQPADEVHHRHVPLPFSTPASRPPPPASRLPPPACTFTVV